MALVKEKKSIAYFLFLVFLLCPFLVWGADFSLLVPKNTFEVGENIPVKIILNSPSQATNAVSGVISFSAGFLQVSSLSKVNSVVNMWVQEPSYYNSDGQVNFEGVTLNPGFTGQAGTILTVNFKAKTSGQTKISFSNGSILANDGEGTNILKKLGQVSFNVIPATIKKIEVNSPAKTTPKLETPAKVDKLATSTKPDLDINPPEQLAIIEVDSTNPRRARFSFSAQDAQSGIDYYQFSVDGLIAGRLPSSANTYETKDLNSGPHQLRILVVDKNKNQIESLVDFEIAKENLFGLNALKLNDLNLITLGFVVLIIVLILLLIYFIFKSVRRLFLLEKELAQVKALGNENYLKTLPEDPTLKARIVFRGQAEETQAVVLMRNGQIVAETKPGADQQFEFTLDNLPTGFHHFSVVAVEALGNPTLTQDYPTMLSAGASILVSGISVKKAYKINVKTVENFAQKDVNYHEHNV